MERTVVRSDVGCRSYEERLDVKPEAADSYVFPKFSR